MLRRSLPAGRLLRSGGALGLVIGCLAACTAEADLDTRPADDAFAVEELDTFDEPWAMAFLPDGDLLVTERSGTLHLVADPTDDATDSDSESVEVSGVPEVVDDGQGGLGDVLPAPTYDEDGTIYLSWAEAGDGGVGAAVGRARLVTGDGTAALEDLEVIWRQTPKTSGTGHFGHRLAFSPDGEHLFVSSGERQEMDPAQDTTNTLGTVVRLTPDGDPAPGNPLEDDGGVSAEIWSWGHRNPLGLEFAPDGTLWLSEMGPEGETSSTSSSPAPTTAGRRCPTAASTAAPTSPITPTATGSRRRRSPGPRASPRAACSSTPATCSPTGPAMRSSGRSPARHSCASTWTAPRSSATRSTTSASGSGPWSRDRTVRSGCWRTRAAGVC